MRMCGRRGRRLIVGVVVLGAVSFGSGTAYAADEQCGYSNKQCVQVLGKGVYVNRVRAQVTLPCGSDVVGHFQVTIGDFRKDLQDKVFETDWKCGGNPHRSEFVEVERGFADRTLACSQFFVRDGQGYRPQWGRPICVTLRSS